MNVGTRLPKSVNNCICEFCGKPFHSTPSRLKNGKHHFCSRVCQNTYLSRAKVKDIVNDLNCTCDFCGKKFHKKKSHISKQNFCNIDCRKKYRAAQRVKKVCETCGKEFEVIKSHAHHTRFCSVQCHDTYQRRFYLNTTCANCGEPIQVDKTKQECSKTGLFFCSNKCVGEYFSGENSPTYKGTREVAGIVRSYFERIQRPKIFKKYNKVCQICGGQAEHVHHIYPLHKIVEDFKAAHPELDFENDSYNVAKLIIEDCEIFKDENNLVTVCRDCHTELHRDLRGNNGF